MSDTTTADEPTEVRTPGAIGEALADFITGLDIRDTPGDVRSRIRLHILDTIACQIAFSVMPWSKHFARYVERTGAVGPSTVTLHGTRTTPELAAFANACFAHGFEMDDTDIATASHPGVVIVPAALALGQRKPTSGAQFAAAVVAGYETMLRIGRGGGGMTDRGFHSTAILGPFGSAAATAVIEGLTAAECAHALGIAASKASGISEYTQSGGSVKRSHAGFGAQAGIQAALMAQSGVSAPVLAVEGSRGLLRAVTDTPRPDAILAGLSERFVAIETGFKMHCCCAGQHSVLDGVSDLAKENSFGEADIAAIHVRQNPREFDSVGVIRRPADVISSQFSSAFGIALRLLNGSNGFNDYITADREDPRILSIIDRVSYERVDPSAPLQGDGPCDLKIELRDGRAFERFVHSARGMGHSPIGEPEIVSKFTSLVAPILGDTATARIADMVLDIEALPDVGQLASELVVPQHLADRLARQLAEL